MKIDYQIEDGKLQYDINRKAAKIPAWSFGKIEKYEYLTGEELLPPHQKQIIEHTKFTYSALGKAFEKQIKTIKDQETKQIHVLEALKPEEVKAIEYKSDDNQKHLKYKEVFNELFNERIVETYNISKEIYLTYWFNFNLTYPLKGPNIAPINFIEFKGPMHFYNKMKNCYVSIEKIEEDKKNLNQN